MKHMDILITAELDGGYAPIQAGDLQAVFHRWNGRGETPATNGAIWAIVDEAMSDISSLEVCRRLRCDPATASARITMLMESEDTDQRRRAQRAGADDHLVGRLSREMVVDRILSMRLSDETSAQRTFELGDLTVIPATFQARWANRVIPLMPNEFRLLRYFAQHPGRVFTRSQLLAALGKQEPPIDERTVDVWIVRLRRAFRKAGAGDLLRTVRSLGYMLDVS